MLLLDLAWKSLRNRRVASLLTLLSIALSVALLLGVERVRQGARESFSNTISQTDLIVGARTGQLQLLLYTIFHMGSATNNIGWDSYQRFAQHPAIEWSIPISLGDSHRGYRVVATNESFYAHYRFREDRSLDFASGQAARGIFDVVLGAEVAEKLAYKLGDSVVLAHGLSDGEALLQHSDKPFRVAGILKRTATPLDRALYISLEGMEALHVDWQNGMPPLQGGGVAASTLRKETLQPKVITAFLLRLKSRVAILQLQREINFYDREALMSIVPGVALSELWDGLSSAETGLRVIGVFVLLVSLLGLLIALYTSLESRRREMAILRAVGAGPGRVLALLILESGLLSLAGAALGVGLVYALLAAGQGFLEARFGLYIPLRAPETLEYIYLAAVLAAGTLLGILPAWRAYRNTLSDGLAPRV